MNDTNCAECEAYWAAVRGEISMTVLESRICPTCYDTCGEDFTF